MHHGLNLFDVSIFHSSFKISEESLEDSHQRDEIASEEDLDSNLEWPGSPGMELLIHEEQEASKRLNKATQFNRAFEVCRVLADKLSGFSTAQFEKNLDIF